jgi:CRP-like cAMP-binding protein
VERHLVDAAIFRGMDGGSLAAMTSQLPAVGYPAGHVIFADGDIADCLYIIDSGKVKICCGSLDGRQQQLFTVAGPSDMFGDLSMFDPGPRSSTATALTDVHAAQMDRDALRRWLIERPEIAERLLRMLAHKLRRNDDQQSEMMFTDVAGRVARQLLELAQRFGVRDGVAMRVDHGLTQEELGQLVGATREPVNKVLMEFSRRGWIRLDGKSVLIMDSERLARRAR